MLRVSDSVSPTHQPQQDRPRQVVNSAKRRVRTRQACEPCRKRRRKCNGHLPCSQCKTYSYHCEYQTLNKSNQIPASDVSDEEEEPLEKVLSGRRSTAVATAAAAEYPELQRPGSWNRAEKVSRPQQTRRESVPSHVRAMVDPVKGRYSNAFSSILLPRRIGHNIDLPTELKFHSYGWNLSTRIEPVVTMDSTLRQWLTHQDMITYSLLFFKVIDPVFHFIDQTRYFERCSKFWTSSKLMLEDFEALIAGVVALGSYFSENPSAVEGQLVEHARRILDIGCASAPGRLSLDQSATWVCRTLYLRLTTRPHLAWYASCASMHVAEAQGMHVDLREVDVAAQNASRLTLELMTSRKNLLQCATFLNALISVDYGRSRVVLQGAVEPDSEASSDLAKLTHLLIAIEDGLQPSERLEFLSRIRALPEEPPAFVLLKTDVAIHMYRRHVNLENERLSSQESSVMLAIIKSALTETRCLLPYRLPWWNTIFTPFQSLLILLAMDSDESLALVNETVSVLSAVSKAFPSPMTTEVLNTANTLVQGFEKKKIKQAKFLNKATSWDTPSDTAGLDSGVGELDPMQMIRQPQSFMDSWVPEDMNWLNLLGGTSAENLMNSEAFEFP